MYKLLSKLKSKKGFSLIELIVVIAIIGILVMLAAPRFLGYTEKARVARIQNDIKVVESKMTEEYLSDGYLFSSWGDKSDLELEAEGKTIYSITGKVKNVESGNYELVNDNIIKKEARSKLEGTFYVHTNGKVYYIDNKSDNGKDDVVGENDTDGDNCPTLTCNMEPIELTQDMVAFLDAQGGIPDLGELETIISFYKYNGRTLMFQFGVMDGEIMMAIGTDFDMIIDNPPKTEEEGFATIVFIGVDEGDGKGFQVQISQDNIPLPNCYKEVKVNGSLNSSFTNSPLPNTFSDVEFIGADKTEIPITDKMIKAIMKSEGNNFFNYGINAYESNGKSYIALTNGMYGNISYMEGFYDYYDDFYIVDIYEWDGNQLMGDYYRWNPGSQLYDTGIVIWPSDKPFSDRFFMVDRSFGTKECNKLFSDLDKNIEEENPLEPGHPDEW